MTKVTDLSVTSGGERFVNPKQVCYITPTGSIEGHTVLYRIDFSNGSHMILSQGDMLKLWPHLGKQVTA